VIVDEYVPAPTLACMVTEEEVPKLASVLYTTPMLDAIPFVELMTPSITAVVLKVLLLNQLSPFTHVEQG